jgi:hypothetical protein
MLEQGLRGMADVQQRDGLAPEAALRRIETIIAQARATLAAGDVPDLGDLAAAMTAVGPVPPGSAAARQLLAVAAEVEMLTRATREAQAMLRQRIDGTGRSQHAARAYARALPGGRA